ncbi:hypothetical protein [Rhodococcus phenolicus]|uniref:hypothetical protein n=1 Tax=Rhodococcus phenolicus TaxID=263849 RepID=UPI0012E71750|nr:hypothetical protein [Rhodococcus phenolicus]
MQRQNLADAGTGGEQDVDEVQQSTGAWPSGVLRAVVPDRCSGPPQPHVPAEHLKLVEREGSFTTRIA